MAPVSNLHVVVLDNQLIDTTTNQQRNTMFNSKSLPTFTANQFQLAAVLLELFTFSEHSVYSFDYESLKKLDNQYWDFVNDISEVMVEKGYGDYGVDDLYTGPGYVDSLIDPSVAFYIFTRFGTGRGFWEKDVWSLSEDLQRLALKPGRLEGLVETDTGLLII